MVARFLFPVLAFYFLLSCQIVSSRDQASIRSSGKIYVGMTEDDRQNINYPLAVEFARYLNVELVIVEITWEEAFMLNGVIPADIETNDNIVYNPDIFKKVDIICSTFTVMEWRKRLFDFALTLNSAELLITGKNSPAIKDYSELAGKTIAFMAGTTFETNLKRINTTLNGEIKLVPTTTGSDSKELLQSEKVFGIILDADEALNFNVQNNLKYNIALPISPMTKTAWALEKGNNLRKEAENFFRTIESNGILNQIFNSKFKISYSSYIEKINMVNLHEKQLNDLDQILARGKIVVALRERKFIYQEGGEKQFMHALAEEFAEYLGVSLEYIITPSLNKYWETENGKLVRDSSYTPEWFNYFDVACDIFSPLPWRKNKINLVAVYPSQYSVISKKEKSINSIEDLKGLKCVTTKGSSYEDILVKNGLSDFYYESANSFLPDVMSGKADYTIMDNAFSELSAYPDLESKISLGSIDECWGLRKDQPKLQAELEKFIVKSREKGLINILMKAMERRSLQSSEAFIQSYYESSQTGQLPYVIYGAEEGLPQENIFSIFQDRKGYMWLGTNSGAVRYNGREMKSIGYSQGLGDNIVTSINQDSTGVIYLATSRGIATYENDTISARLFTNISFQSIFVDKDNNKWFSGINGLYILENNGNQRHLNNEFPALPGMIYAIGEDEKTGDKYFATAKGVYCYSQSRNNLEHLTYEDSYSIFIDSRDSIWISTRNGLLLGSINDLKTGNYLKKSRNLNGLLNSSNSIIKSISTTKYGSIWLLTDSKVIQVVSTDQSAVFYSQEIGLRNNKILSFLIDRENNIWVGFSGGLQRLSNNKGLRNFFPNKLNSFIYSVLLDENDRLWISSNNGVFYFDNQLFSYAPFAEEYNQKFVVGELPGKNLLFANTEGMYEVDVNTLQVVRKNTFEENIISIDNLFISSKGEIVLLSGINGFLYYFRTFDSDPAIINENISSDVFQLVERNGKIIGGNSKGLIELKDGHLNSIVNIDCKVGSLCNDGEILWLGTECGLGYITNKDYFNIQLIPVGINTVIKSILPAKNKNYLWLGTNHGIAYFNKNSRETEFFIDSKDGLSGDEITPSGLLLDRNDLLWIGTYHGISNFNIRAKTSVSYTPECYIERVLLNGNKIDIQQGQIFRYNQNNFVFEISALSFSDEESIEYDFYLRGTSNNYSSYHTGQEFKAYYNNLPPGNYEFIYKAKGKNNIWGYAEKLEFNIKKAWYNTWFFRIALIIAVAVILGVLYRLRIKTIEAQKNRLELLVKERTHELEEANAEIQSQRDLATSQRDMITEQKKEITDSIYYAERIQRSLLPQNKILEKILPEHFILYKPRDIVSGDFYWVFEKSNKVYIAAVDCTGHGVPGALMSMLGISFLNEIVNKSEDITPEEILNNLRMSIIRTLQQGGHDGGGRDGMDMSLVAFDKNRKTIWFAGANNPLYLVRDGNLEEIKGDKMPVGIHERMNPFSCHSLEIQKNDTFYIFSDGYADQFGGPHSKKFMYSNFKHLLVELREKPLVEQCTTLQQTMDEWKGNAEQIDDMVVIGLRF